VLEASITEQRNSEQYSVSHHFHFWQRKFICMIMYVVRESHNNFCKHWLLTSIYCREKCVELYLHSPIRLHDMVLN
jgi:hypothetical protein